MDTNNDFKFCYKGTIIVSLIWSVLFIVYIPLIYKILYHFDFFDNTQGHFSFTETLRGSLLLFFLLISVRILTILLNRSKKFGRDYVTKKITTDPDKLQQQLEENKEDSSLEKVWDFLSDRFIVEDINVHASGSWKYIGIAIFLITWYFFGLEPFDYQPNIIFILFIVLFVNEAYQAIFVPGKIASLSYSFISMCLLSYVFYNDYTSYAMVFITIFSYLGLFMLSRLGKRIFLHIEKRNLTAN